MVLAKTAAGVCMTIEVLQVRGCECHSRTRAPARREPPGGSDCGLQEGSAPALAVGRAHTAMYVYVAI